MPAHIALRGAMRGTRGRPSSQVRSVAFAAGVEIIGTSEEEVTVHAVEELIVPNPLALQGTAAGTSDAVQDIKLSDEEEEVEESVVGSDGEQGKKPAAPTPAAALTTTAPANTPVSTPARAPVPPPRSSSLGRPRPAPIQGLAATLSTSATQARPISPPPPYTPDTATNIDDDELAAYQNPVPGYHYDDRPPRYSETIPLGEDQADLVLEDMFRGVAGWFQGIGADMTEAWDALTYNDRVLRRRQDGGFGRLHDMS